MEKLGIKYYHSRPVSNYEGISLGVNIDIMPIDGIGMTYEDAKVNIKPAIYFNKIISAMNWINTQRV
jgi:hypothetical protein